jgi:hypothetical protein
LVSELIRALLAAIVVGVLPGWFWVRLLIASADIYERVAYSLALSMALVPAVVLIPTRLFGMGVTLSVTLGSVGLVFLAGLVAWARYGEAKGAQKEPLGAVPGLLGTPALMLLTAVFALTLGILLGVVPSWPGALLVTLLVLSGGTAWVLASPGQDAAGHRIAEAPRLQAVAAVRYAALSAVLLLALLRGYLAPLLHGWPYPRGVDRYEHAVMVGMMLSRGSTDSFMLYPPGFHILTAEICRLSGIEPLRLFAILAPVLLVLPALACYALARRVWGWEVGVVAALFSGLIAGGSYEHVTQARYPNLIGVFLLVLAIAALIRLYASASVRDQLTLAVLGSSVVFYHMVATLYEAVVLAVVGVVFLPFLLLRDSRRGMALLCSLALVGILSIAYAWDTYDLPHLVGGLLSGGTEGIGRGGEAVEMAIGTKPAYDIGHLLATTSQPVAWLGLLGALLVAGELLPRQHSGAPQRLAYLTLLVWAGLLFVGSRTSMSGFPDRFERDLGIPLAILAALACVGVVRALRAAHKPLTFGVTLLAVVLVASTVGVQAVRNLEQAAGPSPRLKDRPPPPQIVAAGRWLNEHNEGGNIIATPYLAYVPSRGMLAMGGYTGMQSYDAARIRRGRDLPPFGAGPLWDALWVLKHPAGERTMRVLSENDVRYLVFFKRHPTID